MRALRLFLCILLAQPLLAASQNLKIASFPFELVGSYIVLKARINSSPPLNFILDSGLGSTMITELFSEDSLNLYQSERRFLNGLGTGDTLWAMTSYGNQVQVGSIKFQDHTINILEKDYFNLSGFIGKKINGLIGTDFFNGRIISLDFDKKRLVFYDPLTFKVPKGYTQIPIQIIGDKMYINVMAESNQGDTVSCLMLIDTGAELAAWFRAFGKGKMDVPEKTLYGYIGMGLNGEITGHMGRINGIRLGGYQVNRPVVSFPDSSGIPINYLDNYRNGTVGNQLLSRFNLIFDKQGQQLYLKPNKRFKKPFYYNLSGIELVRHNAVPNLPEVFYVWPGSPAEKAGIVPGDLIVGISNLNGFYAELDNIRHLLEIPTKQTIYMTLQRGDKTIKTSMKLVNPL